MRGEPLAPGPAPTGLEVHRGLLIFRCQDAAFGELFHVAEHLLEQQTVGFHLLLPRSIIWLRGTIPHQGVVEGSASGSERTCLQRSVIHRIQTVGTQRLRVGVTIPLLPDDDRMADGANGADLAVFTGDQIATQEAPFSDIAVLADARPDLIGRRSSISRCYSPYR